MENIDALREECLKTHNEYRALHGVEPLTLNPTINEVAQKWSDHLASNDKFEHSQGSGYGENLAGAYGEAPDGRAAVKMLYDEIKDYNFNKQGFAMNTGHFTQVVWAGSKELGLGVAKNSQGMWIFTFNYSPPGNMMGDFEQNVFKVGEGPLTNAKEAEEAAPEPEPQPEPAPEPEPAKERTPEPSATKEEPATEPQPSSQETKSSDNTETVKKEDEKKQSSSCVIL